MARIARQVAIGYPHHVTQRGNYQRTIFHQPSDYLYYLELIEGYRERYKAELLAYCLMPNHVHFIIIPYQPDTLARLFNAAHMRYAQYLHKREQRVGHLWQGRFFSCILSESHLFAAIRYVERNPVRAGFVQQAWYWQWSSCSTHLGQNNSIISLKDAPAYIGVLSWKDYVQLEDYSDFLSEIRKHTRTGQTL